MSEDVSTSAPALHPRGSTVAVARWPTYYANAGAVQNFAPGQPSTDRWPFLLGFSTGPISPLFIKTDETLQQWLRSEELDAAQVFDLVAVLLSLSADVLPTNIAAIILNLRLEVVESHGRGDFYEVDISSLAAGTIEHFNIALLCLARLESRVFIRSDGAALTQSARLTPTTVRVYAKTVGVETLNDILAGGVGIVLRTDPYRQAARAMANRLIRGILGHGAAVGPDEVGMLLGFSLCKMWRQPLVNGSDGRAFRNFVDTQMANLEGPGLLYVHHVVHGEITALRGDVPFVDLKKVVGSFMLTVQRYALNNFLNGVEIVKEVKTLTVLSRVLHLGALAELHAHGGHVIFYGGSLLLLYPKSSGWMSHQIVVPGDVVTTITLVGSFEDKLRIFNFLSALFGANMRVSFGGLLSYATPYRAATIDIQSAGGNRDRTFDDRVINPFVSTQLAGRLLSQSVSVTVGTEVLRQRIRSTQTRAPDPSDGAEFNSLAAEFCTFWDLKTRGLTSFV